LNWFYVISLIVFVAMVLAILAWVFFFGGAKWVSYWITQILK
jgi:hypothetical protein